MWRANFSGFTTLYDPNRVTFINTWMSVDAFQAFFSREELKAAMGDAGVTAPPTFIVAIEA